jgi:hypothetical protein
MAKTGGKVFDSQVSGTPKFVMTVDTLHSASLGKEISMAQKVDLTEISEIASKGRVQDKDYNPNLIVIDRLIAQGIDCIPFLIKEMGNSSRLPKSVVSHWSKTEVGDVALIILTDFFTDEDWKKATIPGTSWNEIIEIDKAENISAEESLRKFIRKHGRGALIAKWTKIWNANKDRVYWDPSARCFKRK